MLPDGAWRSRAAMTAAKSSRLPIWAPRAPLDLIFPMSLSRLTAGSLCWFEDLDAFFVSCAALLQDGGELVVHEIHPYTEMLSTPEEQEFDPVKPYHAHRSYFADVAWEEEARMAYGDPASRKELSFISYPHTLSDIFQGTISAGIRITDFREYPHDLSSSFSHLQEEGRVPLSFLLHGVR